jgi:hypothetical protein
MYTLKMTHYNTTANVFFETAPENAGLLPRLSQICQSIHEKNNVISPGIAYDIVDPIYAQEQDGTYTRTVLQTSFTSIDQAETRFNDFLNSPFWQENVFEWNKNNLVKGRFEVLDENGNMVRLLHDNRSISVQGTGPSAWAPYVPLENV